MARDNFLYMNLYNDLKKKIEDHVYEVGEKIPSDDELKNMFGVSMITVKKALSMLKDEGLLQRIPGVGTFVKERVSNHTIEDRKDTPPTTNKIGVIFEHVSSSFGLDLLYKIDRLAEEKGYKAITRFSYYNREKETDEIDFLVSCHVSGLIIMPCHGVYYNPKLLKLILAGFPVVVIDKKLDGISVPSVRTDNKNAIKTLVKQLWEIGCKRMGFISSEIIGTSSLLERRNGFYEATTEYGIHTLEECTLIFDENIYEHPPKKENIEKAYEYLKDNINKHDGFICAEYSLMPAILEAANRLALEVNKDIQIACVDGPEGLPYIHMKQNEINMAIKIVELLFSQMSGKNTDSDFIVPAILKK